MEVINDFDNDKGFHDGDFSDRKARRRAGHDNNGVGNKALIGVVFVVAGLFLVLKNMDIMPYYFERLLFSWPMLLVAIGFVIALGSRERTAGWIVMAVGGFFLLPYIFNETFHIYKLFWPAVFIVIGVILITTRNHSRFHGNSDSTSGDDYIEYSNIFSGTDRKVITDNFRGGNISSVFGGSELDLTGAKLAQGRNILDIACVFGGVTIIVPDTWNVIIEVTPIIGGFTDSRKKTSLIATDSNSQLVIKGAVVFGGGEIK